MGAIFTEEDRKLLRELIERIKKREERPFEIKWPEIKWPDIGGALRGAFEWFLKGLEAFRDWIADGLKAFWDRVIPVRETLTKELSESLRTASPDWAKPLTNELTHYYLEYMDKTITSIIAANPYIEPKQEKPLVERIKPIVLPAATVSIAAAITAQLAELIHPLRELRVSDTVRSILHAIGLFTVTSAIWNILYGESLIQPLKYDLNSILRPWLPPQSVVDTMLFQEGIDEATWEDYYKKIGWDDKWIKAWKKARYRPPSVFIIYRVMEWPNTPEAWIDKVLRYHAYDEEDREVLKQFFKWYALKDEFERYASKVINWYKKGMISKDRLISELSELPYSKEVIEWKVKLADFEYEMELLEDKVSTVREGFRKGKITEVEYINLLKSYGIPEDRINAWLELDKLKRKVELRKTVVSLETVG